MWTGLMDWTSHTLYYTRVTHQISILFPHNYTDDLFSEGIWLAT